MKKNLAAFALLMGILGFCNQADAASVGYINYPKVQDNFAFAQAAIKEVDAKALELQQYMVDKEKQYKALDTPLKKQNFEDATAREFNATGSISEIKNTKRRTGIQQNSGCGKTGFSRTET